MFSFIRVKSRNITTLHAVLPATKRCEFYPRPLGTSGMLLSLCKETLEEAGHLSCLPTESGADSPDNPGVGTENNMAKVLTITTPLLVFAFGRIFTLSWQDVLCMFVQKPFERQTNLIYIERGQNDHLGFKMLWPLITLKGLSVNENGRFCPWVEFSLPGTIIPFFKTQFFITHAKQTRNQSSQPYYPRSFIFYKIFHNFTLTEYLLFIWFCLNSLIFFMNRYF